MAELCDHLSDLLDGLEQQYELNEHAVVPILTGLPRLDAATGGLGAGGWLLRGGVSAGSSALLLRLVRGIALRDRRPVVRYVTTDLSPEEITRRLICNLSHLRVDQLRAQQMDSASWTALGQVISTIAELKISIIDARGWSHGEFELWCREDAPHVADAASWLAIDGLDGFAYPGSTSLARLERITGRHVIATTHRTFGDANAASIITTIRVDDFGHRELVIDRSPVVAAGEQRIPISIHGDTLELTERPELTVARAGQLRLDGVHPDAM